MRYPLFAKSEGEAMRIEARIALQGVEQRELAQPHWHSS